MRRSPRENVQTKMIAGADYDAPCTAEIFTQAKENLHRHFSVVGLSERFEESLALMKLRFGWKLECYSSFNVARTRPKKRDLPQSTLDLSPREIVSTSSSMNAPPNFLRRRLIKRRWN